MTASLRYNPFRLLNSVPFGIALMVGIGLYIAGGSARPWFRDAGWDAIPGLGYWFDKTDMQFFDAWPLKVMIGLLVCNLVVVTWRRIPLTPPRYGVWCVHAGIITLVLGTAIYYHLKVEGRVRLYTNPANGANSVSEFYDKDERSLYVQVNKDLPQEIPLPNLPRMKAYDALLGNEDALIGRGMSGLEPRLQAGTDASKTDNGENYGTVMKWGHPVYFDVIGYFPYAEVERDFAAQAAGGETGIQIDSSGVGADTAEQFDVVQGEPESRFGVQFRHVKAPEAKSIEAYRKAAEGLFHLSISTTGPGKPAVEFDVQPGGTYVVPGGTVVHVLSYDPSFPMRETGQMVRVMMLAVKTPTQMFWRTVIDQNPKQTDFRLGEDGRPMGMGAKALLDPNLDIAFKVSDPMSLLPLAVRDSQGPPPSERHTFITAADSPGFTDIVTSFTGPTEVREETKPDGESLDMELASGQQRGPFQGPPAADSAAGGKPQEPAPKLHLNIKRVEHLVPADQVLVVPRNKRDTNVDDSGLAQVARVRVRFGDFHQDVLVPFSAMAYEGAWSHSDPDIRWHGGVVMLPGVPDPIRLQLGNHRRPLPATLTLDKFEAVKYPGAGNSFLDYKSTVTMSTQDAPDGTAGDSSTDVARMNHPIYYDHGNWLFFQASYEPTRQEWTELGVGNRPAVDVMVCGCVMIFVGLMYAFYLKPIIIRKMKQNAIAAAAARGKAVVLSIDEPETSSV